MRNQAIRDWANESLSADTQAVSDGLPAFKALREEVASHLSIVIGSARASAERPQFQWVNIVLGNLKTSISGTYHAFKFGKYAPRYLADFQYRFNRRYDLESMLANLLQAAAKTRPWPEDRLKSADLRT